MSVAIATIAQAAKLLCQRLGFQPFPAQRCWGDWDFFEGFAGQAAQSLHLVALYELLLARPKVRTRISARGLRSKFRSYASLCLLATYLAGCCHMGLSLGVQSHPYLEARRYSVHACIPGMHRTRPMNPRLRPEWLALRALTLAARKILSMMFFCRSCLSHWSTALVLVAMTLRAWLEVQSQPHHASILNQATELAFVEVPFDGSIWVPISVIGGALLAALRFRKYCTMPGPKSGEVEATLLAV